MVEEERERAEEGKIALAKREELDGSGSERREKRE
jgi:hypothetical protein